MDIDYYGYMKNHIHQCFSRHETELNDVVFLHKTFRPKLSTGLIRKANNVRKGVSRDKDEHGVG